MYITSIGQADFAQAASSNQATLLMAGGLVVFIGGLALINRQISKRPKRKMTKKEQRIEKWLLPTTLVLSTGIYYGFMRQRF